MNDVNGSHATPSGGLGKAYTDQVVKSIGPKTDSRLKEVMTSFIRHVHDFAREVDLTFDEWMAGVEMVSTIDHANMSSRPKLNTVDQLGWPNEHKQTQRRPAPLRRNRPRIVRFPQPLPSHFDRSLTHSSLVDDITFRKAAEATNAATASAVLGPFWRHDTPLREFGSSITFDTPADGQVAYIHGIVTDAKTKKPIAKALIDVWLASTNGT